MGIKAKLHQAKVARRVARRRQRSKPYLREQRRLIREDRLKAAYKAGDIKEVQRVLADMKAANKANKFRLMHPRGYRKPH